MAPYGGGGAPGLVLYEHPEVAHFEQLIDAVRARLADLELEYGVERAKVDSVRSKLFASLRPLYQERDRLRLLIRYRNIFIDRLLSEGEAAAEEATGDYQHAEKEQEREYDSTASSLEGKRELDEEQTTRLKRLWKKLVNLFHPDRHEQDPEQRETYERLTQVINDARDRGDIDLMEKIARNPEAFIREQGWASVELDGERGVPELRALFEHLQMRILEAIAALDELKASPDYELYTFEQEEEGVVDQVISDQREELELETLRGEMEQKGKEIEELTGEALDIPG